MPSLEESLSDTINEITSAFKDVSRNGGVSLHQTRVLDDCGSDAELEEAGKKDTDISWQDVPNSAIEKPDLSLCFLDPIGLRYYLPAYMIWELKQFSGAEWVDCNTHGSVHFILTIDKSNFVMLTPKQSRAVCKFLQFYVEYGDEYEQNEARQTLKQYWGKFA